MGLWFLILTMWLIVFMSIRRVTRMAGSVPLDNPGIILLLVLLIYVTLPPLFWLLQGGEYISILSGRLYAWQPTYDEQLYLTLLGFSFMLALVIAQWQYQSTKHLWTQSYTQFIPKRIFYICLILIFSRYLVTTTLQLAGVIRIADSYGDSYRAIQELPLALGQLLNILGGISLFAKIVALVWLFQRWQSHKQWIYVFLVFTLISIDPAAGRSGTFLTLFTCLILWNKYVRRLSNKQFALIGLLGLLAFFALGLFRGLSASGIGLTGLGPFDTGLGEFDGLWGNAIELRREALAGLKISAQLYFSEFYSPIPSNILPFDKLSYSIWYLDEFYPEYKAAGGGNMFGLLAQLSIGFGLPEAAIRGLMFGWFLGWLTSYLNRDKNWWSFPALVYVTIMIFYTVRNSTFSIVYDLFQVILVGIIIITIGSRLLRKQRAVMQVGAI